MKFSEVTILQGVEFSIFPIDFEWALQQCSTTALPVIDFSLQARQTTTPTSVTVTDIMTDLENDVVTDGSIPS